MASTNVEVKKVGSENSVGVIRRFTKRVQESGILNRARSLRYQKRELSKFKRKEATLKKIVRMKEIERLKKLGKAVEKKKRR
ncbi:hypothetical protein L0Y49_05155 [bacterium]|nr:hypothetical protein [bacterium]MCI0566030.1 hypothetical protein [bacterium]MCI0680275.1 hypothetical protein [bacterium]